MVIYNSILNRPPTGGPVHFSAFPLKFRRRPGDMPIDEDAVRATSWHGEGCSRNRPALPMSGWEVGVAMSILTSNFVDAVASIFYYVLNIYMWLVIARAVLSWVSPDPYNPIVRFIHTVTEPVLYRIRRRLPVVFGGIDLAPVIVFLAIMFLENFVVSSLHEFAAGLR
jgi:YggT family protein